MGRLQAQITEEQLIDMLEKISETKQETKIKVQPKNYLPFILFI